ncbi:MAG: hypothetical protein ACKVOM_09210 [Ferruginibacter sp.]
MTEPLYYYIFPSRLNGAFDRDYDYDIEEKILAKLEYLKELKHPDYDVYINELDVWLHAGTNYHKALAVKILMKLEPEAFKDEIDWVSRVLLRGQRRENSKLIDFILMILKFYRDKF